MSCRVLGITGTGKAGTKCCFPLALGLLRIKGKTLCDASSILLGRSEDAFEPECSLYFEATRQEEEDSPNNQRPVGAWVI